MAAEASAQTAAAPAPTAEAQTPTDLRAQLERRLAAGNIAGTIPAAEALVKATPNDPQAWTILGVALRANGQPSSAIVAYRRALALTPEAGGVLSNLGNALKDVGRLDEAIAAHYRAVQADAKNATTWQNLGVALRERGDLKDALAAFQHVLNLAPEHVTAHTDRAQIRLMLGEFAEGWAEFEWRWKLKELAPPNYRQPRWTGADLPEATILLWPEQGFGDTLLGARYAPLVKERVGKVIIGCQPPLVRLFRTIPGVDEVLAVGQTLPEFDVQCPLLSLPGIFGTDLDSVPPPVPVSVSEEARAKFVPVMAPYSDQLKVGIVWSGSVTFKSNHLRAAALERFLPFAEIPGVQLFSLQKGPRAPDLDAVRARALIVDLAPHLDDFADTAAALEALDLVIMTDSSVAHLAGALGRPVWNLLAYVPYWLYLRERTDSPWNPSMRLFRQPKPGDWDSVFAETRTALAALAAQRGFR
jgi:Tfp pilus assembly protein PilF